MTITLQTSERLLLAVGRLDASARLAPAGLARLLELRSAVVPFGAGPDGMIALLRGDREGEAALCEHFDNLLASNGAPLEFAVADGLALAQLALVAAAREEGSDSAAAGTTGTTGTGTGTGTGAVAAALACTTSLWRGGALGGPWLTLPINDGLHRIALLGTPEAWLAASALALEHEAAAVLNGLTRARERLATDEIKVAAIGRASYSALDLFHLLADRLMLTIGEAADVLGQTIPTAGAAMVRLEQLGVAREVTGRARSRAFAYRALINGVAP